MKRNVVARAGTNARDDPPDEARVNGQGLDGSVGAVGDTTNAVDKIGKVIKALA